MRWRRTTAPRVAAEPLDQSRIAWLMAVAACALVPHGSHLPGWLIAVAALLFTWRLAQWKLGWPGASGLVKLLVVVACCAGVSLTFGRLFGREPGVALLTLMLVLKLHELKSVRDGHTVVLLGYFMLLTAFLYSQTPAMAAALGVSMTVITAALIALTGPPAAPHALLRHAAWMMAQALPFMLVLFVPLVLVVALDSTLYGDWRHLYFVYPALLTLAVGGLQAAMQQRQVWYQAGRAWMARLCTVLLLACMGHMAFTGSWICRNHPHQQVYFNALAGQHVAKRFDRDIWGLSARDGIEFILLHDSRQHIRVSGDHVIQNLRMLDAVSRARIEPVLRSDEWDYEVVTYRNVIGDLSEPPFWTPFYTVEVDGTPIMTVIRSNRNSVTKSVVP